QDGFDGTAQGYGYKTKQNLLKARWYFLNQDKIRAAQNEAQEWLKANPEAAQKLNEYTSEDNLLYSHKDGEEVSLRTFLDAYRESEGTAAWFLELEENPDL